MCSNPWYGFILRIELKYSKEGFKDGKGSRIAIMRSGQTPLVCSAWRRLRIPHGTLQLPCEGSGGAGAGLCSLQWQDWREPCWDHWTWTPMLVLHSQEHHWRIQLRQNVWLHTGPHQFSCTGRRNMTMPPSWPWSSCCSRLGKAEELLSLLLR